ncbi:ABC transporter ATP-binding protein [Pendulispora brunnea]|uniref:ABC transporter ATP-binding protein n=1 Tax=Pendulispora brunnea TaxID=2905690 RepID=A0ABZ2K4J4_9BACT
MPVPILRADGLVRDLGNGVRHRVLDHVDVSVHEGEFLALTGPSGSGKSTLLYLLGALDRPTEGRILLGDLEVSALDDDERARLRGERLGFVFQFHFLLPELSVLENIVVPLWRRGGSPREALEARAMDVLGALGLADLAGRRPHQLSGGQQQRVSIARAIAGRPSVLLADEPTGNLDSKNGEIVMDIFRHLAERERMAIVMVTHEMGFAARTHRQIELRDGKIVSERH